jgi:hypothetical protein
MIIFGIRSSLLLQFLIASKCVHCNNAETVHIFVFQKYFHVFWIPFFPIGQRTVSQCTFCKQVLETNQMPESYHEALIDVKQQTKTPWWAFIGVGVIGLLFIVSLFSK